MVIQPSFSAAEAGPVTQNKQAKTVTDAKNFLNIIKTPEGFE
jgi:hypothetical protein